MPLLFDALRSRQDYLADLISKGEYSQPAKFGRNYAVLNKDLAVPMAAYCDSGAMCQDVNERLATSKWVISTAAMDREGDVLVPKGCLPEIEAYRRNPIVDYDHRRFHVLPIGKSVGDGILPVTVTESAVMATCQHHSETQFADEVARLVFKKMLNGASVSFVPVIGERLGKSKDDKVGTTPRFKFSRWQITAWSICPVPINPEGLRMELSAGWIKTPELIKSLSPFAQKPAIWSPGFSFEDTQMTDIKTLDAEQIGAVRFHKAKFSQEDACEWLARNGLDASLVKENDKSFDYAQKQCAFAEKSERVADGVYVLFDKAFPPKKKDSDEGADPAKKKKFPPKQADSAKPGADGKPAKKPADSAKLDQEVEDRSPVDDDKGDDASDAMGQDDLSDDLFADDMNDGMGGSDMAGDMQNAMQGEPTYAGQAAIDVLKHKAAELRFYQQSLQAHDHDGMKALMQSALQECQNSYNNWLKACSKMFPNIDFAKAAALEDDQMDDGVGGDLSMDSGMDGGDDNMGDVPDVDPKSAPDGLSNTADDVDLADDNQIQKRKKLAKSLSKEDLDLLAIQTSLLSLD